MSETKKYLENKEIKKIKPEVNVGILKEKDKKDLEDRIIDTLRLLNSKLTKKEIMELFSKVEASSGLDGLKKELEKEKKLGGKEISEDVLKMIMELIKEAKEVTQKGIEELKIELNKLNESKIYDIDTKVYLSSKFPWIKKLEESKLGENIILDIAGIAVGLIDSAQAVFKILLEIIIDIAMLPKDIKTKFSKK